MYFPPFNDKEAEAGRLGNFPDDIQREPRVFVLHHAEFCKASVVSINPTFFQYQLGSRHSKYYGISKQVEDIISGFKEFVVYLQK